MMTENMNQFTEHGQARRQEMRERKAAKKWQKNSIPPNKEPENPLKIENIKNSKVPIKISITKPWCHNKLIY